MIDISNIKIFLFTTLGMLQYVRINIVNILYLIIAKIDEYFEDVNGNKYLVLVPADESKEIMKNMKNYRPK